MNSIIAMAFLLMGCTQEVSETELPILASSWIDDNGNEVAYRPPQFELIDQHNNTFSSEQLVGKVHVVDFFFTSCPTICPKMTTHLKIVQENFVGNGKVVLISFSIDPIYDRPARLKAYAKTHGIGYDQWKLLNDDNRHKVLDLATEYKVRAFEEAGGGERELLHDGTFVLLDDRGRVRGYYDGLSPETPAQLIEDIQTLLKP